MLKFSLIGNPVNHSSSAKYFNRKFEVSHVNAEYTLSQLNNIDELVELIKNEKRLIALNVTYPFKHEVFKYLDYVTPNALKASAVNTIYVYRKNIHEYRVDSGDIILFGHNTDVVGFQDLIESLNLNTRRPNSTFCNEEEIEFCSVKELKTGSKYNPKFNHISALIAGWNNSDNQLENSMLTVRNEQHKGVAVSIIQQECDKCNALILGTGGASRAVASALVMSGIEYRFVSRHSADGALTYSELTSEIIRKSRLIVDATPLGMGQYLGQKPDINYDALTPNHICVDLVYNPPVTPYLEHCLAAGATVKNGLTMLIGQAEAAWRFWKNMHYQLTGEVIET